MFFHYIFEDTCWWGTKRIDYVLHCPDGLEQFPVSTLMSLCYNSYWESKDLATFVLWQVGTQILYQRLTQDDVKYLWWSFFAKIVKSF